MDGDRIGWLICSGGVRGVYVYVCFRKEGWLLWELRSQEIWDGWLPVCSSLVLFPLSLYLLLNCLS